MKLFFAMAMFVGLLTQTSMAVAAIGCLPGECEGHGPRPRPPNPGCQSAPPQTFAMLRPLAFQGCATEVAESCDKCGSHSTQCLPNFTDGQRNGVSCVYCGQ